MATFDQITTAIDNGKLYSIKTLAAQLLLLRKGCGCTTTVRALKRSILALSFQFNAQVNNDDTNTLYNCVVRAVGGFNGLYQIDPEVQVPGQTVVEVPVVSNFNQNRIDFVTTDEAPTLTLQNYNVNYKPLYGNDPTIALYTKQPDDANPGEFVYPQNLQTPPILTYEDDDPTKDIISIQWQLAIGTDGYILISGIGSISTGNTGGVGAKPITLTYSQDDLVYDAVFDQYYLPLALPGTAKPYYATLNGITISVNYDENTLRFSGFANNAAIVIRINVI